MNDKSRNTDPQFDSVDQSAGGALFGKGEDTTDAPRDLNAQGQPTSAGRAVDPSDFNDLDEDSAIPTYQGSSPSANSTNATDKLYNRTGRAAPQNIPPIASPKSGGSTDNTETASFERPSAGASNNAAPKNEGAGAAAAAAASQSGYRNESRDRDQLASDAPTTTQAAVNNEAPTTVTQRPFAQSEQPVQNSQSYQAAQAQPTQAPPTQVTRQLDRPNDGYADTDFAPAVAGGAGAGAVATHNEQPVMDGYSDQPTIIEDARRGTLDFGLLIIRATIGTYLIVKGVFTFFTLGGSGGLAGLEAEFAGYNMPEVLAILLPSIELAAGVFLLLGLMTPVAAAVALVATSFNALHQVNVHEGGWGELGEPLMLALILTLIAIGLQFTGPGRISLDSGRGWARRPLASSWIFVIVGIALAVVLWWFGAGVNPIGSGSLVQP